MECEPQEVENPNNPEHFGEETAADAMADENEGQPQSQEDPKWWDNESQYLLDSQQLVEGLSLCDEFLQSQSPNRDGNPMDESSKNKPRLSDYAKLGPEDLKKDLEEYQNLEFDPADLDTPPDFRLSQLVNPILFPSFLFPFYRFFLTRSLGFSLVCLGVWIARELHCLGRKQGDRLTH